MNNTPELETAKSIMAANQYGVKMDDAPVFARCRSCGAKIMWGTWLKSGKKAPFDMDGASHFATCPNAASHRRVK